MRVLHVLPSLSPHWGGPVYFTRHLSTELAGRGISCVVFATKGPLTGRGQAISGAEVRLFDTDVWSKGWIAHSPGLGRALAMEVARVDVVHIHELWHYPHWAALRAATQHRVPFVISPHGQFDPWMLRHRGWAKRLYAPVLLWPSLRRTFAVHVLTKREAAQARAFGVRRPMHVIPNAVDISRQDRLTVRDRFFARHPELRGKRLVLFIGRLHPQKGVDILLEAFARVVPSVPAAHLLITGPDEVGIEADLRAVQCKLGLARHITFTGPLYGGDKDEELAAADVFVLPSRAEGQSSAMLEAMASGVPVVVSMPANSPDVASASAGLVAGLSPEAVAVAIDYLLRNPGQAEAMGARGRTLVQQHFTWRAVGDQFVSLYNQVSRKADAVGPRALVDRAPGAGEAWI
jgi:glycosyltransferase involved in cell wall biosynthesis